MKDDFFFLKTANHDKITLAGFSQRGSHSLYTEKKAFMDSLD